uniref:DNA-directed RNA polymerase III subunit RPC1-like n=1 Tax=Fragaria vesca subsp. vesca TaxID=101020 RepID=UPI0005C8A966|nr:PREDICTED: DNA-directed RNA polymerase III subunit RPC1-like [Fragaria vesca subsp. vesca]
MGPTKRVRLIEDDLGEDKLLSLVQDGEVSGDDRCLVRKRRCVSSEDVDPRQKLFLENLRGDGGSYALEVVQEDGVSELISYHQEDGLGRRIVRRCISDEDVDHRYKLFMENLREDENSYALEVVQEDGVLELIWYHQDDGLGRWIVRRCISDADVDAQYKLFLENLREDGNSYVLEVVQENGISELISYHNDGLPKRSKRRCVSTEDADPQYKLFLESLRGDGNSYALEVVSETGVTELMRYRQDNGLRRRVERRSVCNKKLEDLMFVDNSEKSLSLVKHGNDENEHSGDDNSDIMSGDDSYNEHGFSSDDNSHIRSVEDGDNGKDQSGDNSTDVKPVHDGDSWNEQSSDDNSHIRSVDDGDNWFEQCGDDNLDVKSVHDGDNRNEQSSDDIVHVKSVDDDVRDPKSKLFLENLREDENIYAQETFQETGILEPIRYHQNNGLPDEASLVATEPTKNSRVKHKTETENRYTLESLKDPPKRKSSVVKQNAESAALDPASDMENRVSSKRPCLEVPNNPEELSSDTPETFRSPRVKEKPVIENSNILKLFQICREKRSAVVKKKAKVEITNPVSGRTRGHSRKRPHLQAHNTSESFRSSSLKEKMETKRTLRRMKKEKVKIDRPNKSAHVLNKEETKEPKTLRNERSESLQSLEDLQEKKGCRMKKNVKEEGEYPYSDRTNELPNKRPGSEVLHFAKCGYNGFAKSDLNGNGDDETESSQTDESYQDFLSDLYVINDEEITYAPQNGRPESYDVEIKDENVESLSDSDLIVLERDPIDGCRTPIKKDSDKDLESPINFREGLLKDLKRPYDQEELLKLLEDWSNQRPARGHAKNLRSGVIKTYALKGEYGKPYSILYQDLAEMIKASDRDRSLNLLRGFFYWLKNVAQDKSFEPWTDAECLNVVPQL